MLGGLFPQPAPDEVDQVPDDGDCQGQQSKDEQNGADGHQDAGDRLLDLLGTVRDLHCYEFVVESIGHFSKWDADPRSVVSVSSRAFTCRGRFASARIALLTGLNRVRRLVERSC